MSYSYVYDEYPAGTGEPGGLGANTNLLGRLASVVEPNGKVILAYDDFGRPRATSHTNADQTVTELLSLGMSGQIRSVLYGHDLTVTMEYDAVGRPESISGPSGMLWQADAYDSAGRLTAESFGNGITQLTTRDILGLPERIEVNRPVMAGPLYDVAVQRNAWTGIVSATDSDGVGLNHSATFTYDGAARLTDATIGTGSDRYSFGYRYDGLQNMTLRTQEVPTGATNLDMVTGTYTYGESGAGPRQLTSVLDDQGVPVANFTYDDAGRMTEDTGKLLTYNGLDQLVQVELPGQAIPLEYSYGYNGLRTYTQHANGNEEYNFTESIRQEGDLRHHYIKIGSRTVARVTMRDLEASPAAPPAPVVGPRVSRPWLGLALAMSLLLLLVSGLLRKNAGDASLAHQRTSAPTRAGPGYALVPLAVLIFANLSCGLMLGSSHKATWTTQETIYFHQGFSAGPTLMTTEAGDIFEERRYEPFGVDIDAYSGPAGGIGPTGGVSFVAEPTNILNKSSDPDTKWSYHGARWVSPQTARWHTPDPIVKAPDAKFMAEPWALHPYQYVSQNPVMYWDPDGRDKKNFYLAQREAGFSSVSVDRLGNVEGWTLYLHHRKDDSVFYSARRQTGAKHLYFDTAGDLLAEAGKLDSPVNQLLGSPIADRPVYSAQAIRVFNILENARSGNKFATMSQMMEYWQNEHTPEKYLIGTVMFAAGLGALGGAGAPKGGPGVGAMNRLKYEPAPYHGRVGNAVKSKAPTNGQGALDNSLQVTSNSARRVGIDPTTREFVLFDRTSNGLFHGHVRPWKELRAADRSMLRAEFKVSKKGKVPDVF